MSEAQVCSKLIAILLLCLSIFCGISTICSMYHLNIIDSIVGVGMSALLFYSAYKVFSD